jgi:glycerol-3-phosphate acyltransferase PlsY
LAGWTKIRAINDGKALPIIWILIIIISYLLGSIPTGYLVAKSQGIDIRQHGSKNIGATNVLRVMGKKWGYPVFFCDLFKGFLAVRLGMFLGTLGGTESSIAGVVAAIACILGHNYPVWLGFKGGKGVATSDGVVIALFPSLIVLIIALVWVAVFFLSKYVSLASICAAVSLPASSALLGPWIGHPNFCVLILFSVVAAGLAVWRHRTNITFRCRRVALLLLKRSRSLCRTLFFPPAQEQRKFQRTVYGLVGLRNSRPTPLDLAAWLVQCPGPVGPIKFQ